MNIFDQCQKLILMNLFKGGIFVAIFLTFWSGIQQLINFIVEQMPLAPVDDFQREIIMVTVGILGTLLILAFFGLEWWYSLLELYDCFQNKLRERRQSEREQRLASPNNEKNLNQLSIHNAGVSDNAK